MAAARNFFVETVTKNSNQFWQLYVAAARIEEQLNHNLGAAKRIYSNASKYFKDRPEFVICFVEFLMDQTEEKMMENSKKELRQIFDHILPQFDVQHKDTLRIWSKFIEFEQRNAIISSDVTVLEGAERKRDDGMKCDRIQRLLNSVERFSFLDLLPVSKQYRDTLVHAQQTVQRKAAQQLSAMQNKNLLNTRHRLSLDGGRQSIVSRIKLNAFEMSEIKDRQSDWVDMTTLIDDVDDQTITGPEVENMYAFRPGVRFLAKVDDDDEEEEEGENQGEGEQHQILKMYPKLKELLQRLPPPPQTQLLYLKNMDQNTKMIDPDSFLTFMKLKLSSIV